MEVAANGSLSANRGLRQANAADGQRLRSEIGGAKAGRRLRGRANRALSPGTPRIRPRGGAAAAASFHHRAGQRSNRREDLSLLDCVDSLRLLGPPVETAIQ